MLFSSDKEVHRGAKTLEYMLKTLYVMVLFLVGMGILLKFIGSPEDRISLRRFPYPYHAALAISNDIRGTDSKEEFLAIQRYLCTEESTPWGMGLGLEAGNSFWFCDNTGQSTFTVLDSAGELNEESAAVIADFIRAGYIDALNTYGYFSGGEFQPAMADKGLEFFDEYDLSVAIWVNNEEEEDFQCIGRMTNQLGDNPESAFYHAYLLPHLGVRYVELGGYTNVVGQEAVPDIKRWFKKAYEFVISVWRSTKARKLDLDWNNRLINPHYLDDGQLFLRFKRFVNTQGHTSFAGLDVNYTARQLDSEILDQLTQLEGYMVVYTRLGGNESYSEWIPEDARKALRGLANRFRGGRILVTTVSRLLDYYIVHRFLDWDWRKEEGGYIIDINGLTIPIEVSFNLTEEMLQGLTFYTPDPETTRIFFRGEIISALNVHSPGESEAGSVSIPWRWLTFPQGY